MKIQIIKVPYDCGYKELRQGRGPAHFILHKLDRVLEADGHQVKITRIEEKSPFTTEIGTAFELNRLLSKTALIYVSLWKRNLSTRSVCRAMPFSERISSLSS